VSLKPLVSTGFHPWSLSFLKVARNPRYTRLFKATEKRIMHFFLRQGKIDDPSPSIFQRTHFRSYVIIYYFLFSRFRYYIFILYTCDYRFNFDIFQETARSRTSEKIPDFRKKLGNFHFLSHFHFYLEFSEFSYKRFHVSISELKYRFMLSSL